MVMLPLVAAAACAQAVAAAVLTDVCVLLLLLLTAAAARVQSVVAGVIADACAVTLLPVADAAPAQAVAAAVLLYAGAIVISICG